MRTQTESTGRSWKLGLLGCFIAAVLAIAGMVMTGSGGFGWLALLAGAGLVISAVGAWLTSG